jgi:hypothetical protein
MPFKYLSMSRLSRLTRLEILGDCFVTSKPQNSIMSVALES